MGTHSSILARKISWTEASGGLQFMGVAKTGTRLKQLSTHCFTPRPQNANFTGKRLQFINTAAPAKHTVGTHYMLNKGKTKMANS